jgi:hypothetical protein
LFYLQLQLSNNTKADTKVYKLNQPIFGHLPFNKNEAYLLVGTPFDKVIESVVDFKKPSDASTLVLYNLDEQKVSYDFICYLLFKLPFLMYLVHRYVCMYI